MKIRIITIISVFVLIFSLGINCFAQSADLFYYNVDKSEIEKAISEAKSGEIKPDVQYIENVYLKNSEKADMNKVSYDLSKIYVRYEWTGESIIAFMRAEDKAAYLNTMTPHILYLNCYYEGVRLENFFSKIIYEEDTKKYRMSTLGSTYEELTRHSNIYLNKDELIEILESDNIIGYEIIKSLNIYGLSFIIAEKDGETVAIYMPFEKAEETYRKEFWDVYNENKEALDGRILTVSQMEAFFESYTEHIINNPKEYPSLLGSSVSGAEVSEPAKDTDTAEKPESTDSKPENVPSTDEVKENKDEPLTDTSEQDVKTVGAEVVIDDGDEKPDFPWEYVGIGAGAVVLVVAIVLLIALKKKKA